MKFLRNRRFAFLLTAVIATKLTLLTFILHNDFLRHQAAAQASVVTNTDTDLKLLKELYTKYNAEYFNNELPQNVTIRTSGTNPGDMASVVCSPDALNCEIRFDLKYVLAPQVAKDVVLHEQCHIAAWMASVDSYPHGPNWQICMLKLDTAGAFRKIMIDDYVEKR